MLSIEKISFSYCRQQPLLTNISLQLAKGEKLGILGKNGCGKTTLLKLLCANLPLHQGNILLEQIPLKKVSKKNLAQKISLLPQVSFTTFPFSVREIVEMGRYPHCSPLKPLSKKDRAIVKEAIEQANLEQLIDRPINQLSGGERQRVFIARALAQQSQYLLLDEPDAHLDPGEKQNIYQLLSQLKEKSLLVVSHDILFLKNLCQRVAILNNGEISAKGATAEVLKENNLKLLFGDYLKD